MIDQEQPATKQGVKLKIANPDEVPVPKNREVELFARIKRTSKYYYQGLDQNDKPIAFKIDAIRHGFLSFRLNSNNYSCHDLSFFVKDAKGKLIPLTGGTRR